MPRSGCSVNPWTESQLEKLNIYEGIGTILAFFIVLIHV